MEISRQIAGFAADPGPLPAEVRAAARRAFLNMTGCAIGGSREAELPGSWRCCRGSLALGLRV